MKLRISLRVTKEIEEIVEFDDKKILELVREQNDSLDEYDEIEVEGAEVY